MQHEQECCERALQAMEQRRQAAAAQAKAITDEANERTKLPAANSSSMSMPPVPASRRLLPSVNAFASSARASPRENGSRRLLPFANAFASSARALPKDNGRPNCCPTKTGGHRTICLWLRRRLLFVRINHRTLQHQQRNAALARLR